MSAINTKLSSSTTVGRYQALVKAGNRAALANFVVESFDERYFRPVSDTQSRHGFATMAVACLVIEHLKRFTKGSVIQRTKVKKMFSDFFVVVLNFLSFQRMEIGSTQIYAVVFFIKQKLATDGNLFAVVNCLIAPIKSSMPPCS